MAVAFIVAAAANAAETFGFAELNRLGERARDWFLLDANSFSNLLHGKGAIACQDERDNLHQGSHNIRRSISTRRCSCICSTIVASQDSSDDISEKSSILNSSLRGSRQEEKTGDKTRARHMRTCYSLSSVGVPMGTSPM